MSAGRTWRRAPRSAGAAPRPTPAPRRCRRTGTATTALLPDVVRVLAQLLGGDFPEDSAPTERCEAARELVERSQDERGLAAVDLAIVDVVRQRAEVAVALFCRAAPWTGWTGCARSACPGRSTRTPARSSSQRRAASGRRAAAPRGPGARSGSSPWHRRGCS